MAILGSCTRPAGLQGYLRIFDLVQVSTCGSSTEPIYKCCCESLGGLRARRSSCSVPSVLAEVLGALASAGAAAVPVSGIVGVRMSWQAEVRGDPAPCEISRKPEGGCAAPEFGREAYGAEQQSASLIRAE